jgi:hypothetical protein
MAHAARKRCFAFSASGDHAEEAGSGRATPEIIRLHSDEKHDANAGK